jgi:Right handed beta helix region
MIEMKTRSYANCARATLVWLLSLLGLASAINAQTYLSGYISGNLTLAGSPYIVIGNCEVDYFQTLTIEPGVTLQFEQNASISVFGSIQAMGTPSQRITIQATNNSTFWSGIYCDETVAPIITDRFRYCDFQNASTPITTHDQNPEAPMMLEVLNCTFSNCSTAGIDLGLAYSGATVLVKNSVFSGTGNGCLIMLASACYGSGAGSVEFINDAFENLNGTAIGLTSLFGLSSTAQIMNNIFINCTNGVSAQLPWDATVEDCIFVSNTVAMAVPGTLPGQLSQDVAYNDFFACATNFSGYPANFGAVSTTNRNGTPCDFTNNIFANPQFTDYTSFTLQSNSPCVDAGTPDWAWSDMCFPPSLGTSLPDLGIYGGPDACNWLDDVPLLPVEITTSVTNDSLWLNWGALPRSTYQVLYATDLSGFGNWLPFTNGQVLAAAKPTSLEISPAPSTNGAFFRVQSLGRTPGD